MLGVSHRSLISGTVGRWPRRDTPQTDVKQPRSVDPAVLFSERKVLRIEEVPRGG